VIWASFAIVIMILLGVNFDLRITREVVSPRGLGRLCDRAGAYHFAFFGLLFQLLGAVPLEHPEPRGARDGEGHLDGLHHPDRLAAC
jgi:hypothetical protein